MSKVKNSTKNKGYVSKNEITELNVFDRVNTRSLPKVRHSTTRNQEHTLRDKNYDNMQTSRKAPKDNS